MTVNGSWDDDVTRAQIGYVYFVKSETWFIILPSNTFVLIAISAVDSTQLLWSISHLQTHLYLLLSSVDSTLVV